MKVECPSCSTDNDIEFSDHIKCGHCQKATFTGKRFVKAKYFSRATVATATIFFGAYSGHSIGEWFEQERYPIEIEQEIVNLCSNSANKTISKRNYLTLVKRCQCALKETMPEVNYKSFQEDELTFMREFKKQIDNEKCRG